MFPRVPAPSTWRRVIALARLRSMLSLPLGTRLRESFKDVLGLTVTMGVILALAAVLWQNNSLLYLPLVLVLAVAFASFMGGVRQGMASSALALVFLAFYLVTQPLTLGERFASWTAWLCVLMGVAYLTGHLYQKAQERAVEQWDGNLVPFRMAAESVLTLGVVLLDRQGRILSWNAGASRMFGWTAAEMRAQTLARCCEPEGVIKGLAGQALQTAAAQGSYQAEWTCMRKDASRFRAAVGVTALRNSQGELGGYTVSVQDLSDRQDPAATLRKAHQHVAMAMLSQAALSGADPQMLIEHAATFIVQTWQVDYCAVFELQADGLTLSYRAGHGWQPEAVHNLALPAGQGSLLRRALDSDAPVIIRDLRQSQTEAVPNLFVEHGASGCLLVRMPGPKRPYGLLGVLTKAPGDFTVDDQDFLLAISGVLANAQARREQEEDNAKLAAFPRHNPNPVYEFSADGRLTYSNNAAARLAASIGFARPEDLLPPEVLSEVRESLNDGRSREGLQSQIGDRALRWAIYPVPEIQRAHLYAEEITARLNLEAQLRQSQKLQAIGQLASGVAHDFNNILTVMQGFADRILRGATQPEIRADSQQIIHATERAAALTRQLLAFSRRQPLQPRLVDLGETASVMSRMLERLIGENIRLEVRRPDRLRPVQADASMMEQVLLNLAVNARDAMPGGGRLLIEVAEVNVSEDRVRSHPRARPGPHICLTVSDTGCGMDAATLQRIFEPFFTTKGVGKGTGLGLATVYGIVEQHQGWIEVESTPGCGATFRVLLPAAEGQVTPTEKPRDVPVRENSGAGGTILVVEDEELVRELAKATLEGLGYNVLEAANATEARAVWQRDPRVPRLLLTDLIMPGEIGGRALAEMLRRERPDLAVVFCSGYSHETIETRTNQQPATGFLQKPYRPDDLARAVRECLDAAAAIGHREHPAAN